MLQDASPAAPKPTQVTKKAGENIEQPVAPKRERKARSEAAPVAAAPDAVVEPEQAAAAPAAPKRERKAKIEAAPVAEVPAPAVEPEPVVAEEPEVIKAETVVEPPRAEPPPPPAPVTKTATPEQRPRLRRAAEVLGWAPPKKPAPPERPKPTTTATRSSTVSPRSG